MAAPAMAQDTITVTYQGPVFIPDDDADLEIIMPVLVTQALRITNVDVIIDIDHPRMSDLRIRLVNPTGDDRVLADEGNCPNTRNLTNFTFDTGAAQEYGTFARRPPGSPHGPGKRSTPGGTPLRAASGTSGSRTARAVTSASS